MTSAPPRVVVAVGSAGEARDVVSSGERLAAALSSDWEAVFVETPSGGEDVASQANEALSFAAQRGAGVVRIRASSVAEGLCDHLEKETAAIIVMGHRAHPRWTRLVRRSLVESIRSRRPELPIHLVPSAQRPSDRSLAAAGNSSSGNVLKALAAVLATTAAALVLNWALGVRSLSLLFFFPVIAAAVRWGLISSLLAALASAFAFNFFFLEPVQAFRFSAPQTWFMASLLAAVAVYTSLLTANLRRRIALSARSASENAAIAGFAQKLTRVADWQSTAAVVCDSLAEVFGLNVVLLREVEGRLGVEGACPQDLDLSPVDWTAVDWAWSQGEPAGSGTQALTAINWQFQPLRTSLGVLAIVGVARDDGRDPIASEQRLMFDTMLAQAALAHERLRLEDAMRGQTSGLRQDVQLEHGNAPAGASLAS